MLPRAKAILISLVGLVSFSACQSTTNLTLEQPQTVNVQNEPDYFLVTSKHLLSKAEETARKWEASARIIRTESINVDSKGRADWVYYFKSPSKNKILRVDSEGNAFEMDNNLLGSQIEPASWTMDSDKAIEMFKCDNANFVGNTYLQKRIKFVYESEKT